MENTTQSRYINQRCGLCSGFGTLKYGTIRCGACLGKGIVVIDQEIGIVVEQKDKQQEENGKGVLQVPTKEIKEGEN